MPAIAPKSKRALEEGIHIEYLAAPVEILLKDGIAIGAACVRMDLGQPDASGRPRPIPRADRNSLSRPARSLRPSARSPHRRVWKAAPGGWQVGQAGSQRQGVFAGRRRHGSRAWSPSPSRKGRFAAEAIDALYPGKTWSGGPSGRAITAGSRATQLVQTGRTPFTAVMSRWRDVHSIPKWSWA